MYKHTSRTYVVVSGPEPAKIIGEMHNRKCSVEQASLTAGFLNYKN